MRLIEKLLKYVQSLEDSVMCSTIETANNQVTAYELKSMIEETQGEINEKVFAVMEMMDVFIADEHEKMSKKQISKLTDIKYKVLDIVNHESHFPTV